MPSHDSRHLTNYPINQAKVFQLNRSRKLASECLGRVRNGAFANAVLPSLLERSDLDLRQRAFTTELTYGAIRRQKALRYLWGKFVDKPPKPAICDLLDLGTYQLKYMSVAEHAALNETVQLAPKAQRGFVNAVLRKCVKIDLATIEWPDSPTELSYPRWIYNLLVDQLGAEVAHECMKNMNGPSHREIREDGYTQDLSSQLVVKLLGASRGQKILDVCSAPGGKATGISNEVGYQGLVVAVEFDEGRIQRLQRNVQQFGQSSIEVLRGDGRRLPFADDSFEKVLIDAPCSGLGVMGRRPDLRWKASAGSVAELAKLQVELVIEASRVVAPGGELVYSVCTMTEAETTGVVGAILRNSRLTSLPFLNGRTDVLHHENSYFSNSFNYLEREHALQVLPVSNLSDGMFVAKFAKIN